MRDFPYGATKTAKLRKTGIKTQAKERRLGQDIEGKQGLALPEAKKRWGQTEEAAMNY